jgi:hypothetical protein
MGKGFIIQMMRKNVFSQGHGKTRVISPLVYYAILIPILIEFMALLGKIKTEDCGADALRELPD